MFFHVFPCFSAQNIRNSEDHLHFVFRCVALRDRLRTSLSDTIGMTILGTPQKNWWFMDVYGFDSGDYENEKNMTYSAELQITARGLQGVPARYPALLEVLGGPASSSIEKLRPPEG